MKKIILSFVFLAFFYQSFGQHVIIPTPVNFSSTHNSFILENGVSLYLDSNNADVIEYAKQFKYFLSQSDLNVAIQNSNKKGKKIQLSLLKNKNAELGKEGYTLEVNQNEINLVANEPAGIFNAIQTLKQMIPLETANSETKSFEIMGCEITDYPRFGWRGLMLDVSRHFFTVAEIKAYLDKMSEYKFNVFHWHLTDDQGWRIEIKSYPKLTEVGAWRVERHGKFGSDISEPKPGEKATYGGFYTQEQIKDIVNYAADRNITIVPEIDFPGHSMAALAAYPELSVKKEPKYVSPGNEFSEWYGGGKFKMLVENTLNPIDENVYNFIDKVFTEVAQLFPGEYIHMGGDEAYHGYWEENAEVQKFMKKNNIKNSHELQSYFVKRVEKIISKKGKKMIGWDEILEGGLADGAAVMSWRGMKGGIEAAKMGHEAVMTPTTYAYLDYMQGDITVENKIYASLSLEKAYEFEPVPEGVNPKYILGGQGNLWTEAVPTLQFAYYMTYPRAFALAETLWSQKKDKNWDDFVRRTEENMVRFDKEGDNISKAVFDPTVTVYKKDDVVMCKLENSIPNTEIFYSIDNTYPVKFGKKYTGPFQIPSGDLSLRTQTYRDAKPLGRELIIAREDLVKRIKK